MINRLFRYAFAIGALAGGLNARGASYTRNGLGNGSWHDTNSTWKISTSFVSTLPGSSDGASLVSSLAGTVSLFEAPVEVYSLSVGSWQPLLVDTVTLAVYTNLTVGTTLGVGSSVAHPGNGVLYISNTIVSVKSAAIGTSTNSSGELIVRDGGKLECRNGEVSLYSRAIVELSDGSLAMTIPLYMESGAIVSLDHRSEIRISGDQTAGVLKDYVENGWIRSSSPAGRIKMNFDGTDTVISASGALLSLCVFTN